MCHRASSYRIGKASERYKTDFSSPAGCCNVARVVGWCYSLLAKGMDGNWCGDEESKYKTTLHFLTPLLLFGTMPCHPRTSESLSLLLDLEGTSPFRIVPCLSINHSCMILDNERASEPANERCCGLSFNSWPSTKKKTQNTTTPIVV